LLADAQGSRRGKVAELGEVADPSQALLQRGALACRFGVVIGELAGEPAGI
jgi:hypothetical protein